MVEAGEMIHVGVRDERMRRPQQHPWSETVDLAQVEKQGAAIVAQVHHQAGFVGTGVNQSGIECRSHAPAFFFPSMEEQIDDQQNDTWYAQKPCEEILAHDALRVGKF